MKNPWFEVETPQFLVPQTNRKEAAVHAKHRASQCLGNSKAMIKYHVGCSKRKQRDLMGLQNKSLTDKSQSHLWLNTPIF